MMTDGFMDQMELYGAVRKVRDEQRSFTLNAIAEKEIDDKKLDYSGRIYKNDRLVSRMWCD